MTTAATTSVNIDSNKSVDKVIVFLLEQLQKFCILRVFLFFLSKIELVFAGELVQFEDVWELKSSVDLLVFESGEVKDDSLEVQNKDIWKFAKVVVLA